MSIYPRPPARPPAHILDAEVARYAAAGWTIAHRDAYTAVVTSPGGVVNHILHLLLTVFTCGLWAPVWFLVVVTTPGPRRLTLTVRADGSIAVAGPDGRPAGQRSWFAIGAAIVITVLVIVAAVLANAG